MTRNVLEKFSTFSVTMWGPIHRGALWFIVLTLWQKMCWKNPQCYKVSQKKWDLLLLLQVVTLTFSVAKATLQSQMSVRLSVWLSPKPLSLSELLLSTIEPICHQAYWPSSPLTIKPIDHQAHWPSSLLNLALLLQLLSLSACFGTPCMFLNKSWSWWFSWSG